LPFSLDEARAFWIDKVLPGARSGARRVLVARMEGEIVGTVQLLLDMPPNQRHRAEVVKLLVHPEARRRGIARALVEALDQAARREARTLLTLDTRAGDTAEALYRSMGYVLVGVIPRFSRSPQGTELEAACVMYKELASAIV
jgi:ribosomal protein S18 acetylase RimI-like enzyme